MACYWGFEQNGSVRLYGQDSFAPVIDVDGIVRFLRRQFQALFGAPLGVADYLDPLGLGPFIAELHGLRVQVLWTEKTMLVDGKEKSCCTPDAVREGPVALAPGAFQRMSKGAVDGMQASFRRTSF